MTGFVRGELIYEGKAKKVYSVVGHPNLVVQEFKDSLTAFNAQKKGSFANKGHFNRDICSVIYRVLAGRAIATHWVEDQDEVSQVTRKLKMIPLEVVIRNVLAGSTAKKFNLPEGSPLDAPLAELYYKDDALGDPFVSDEQAIMLKTATLVEIAKIKSMALKINDALKEIFSSVGLRLVDFKTEFGRSEDGQILLADEISPDTCRLWDDKSGEKMDKDRFRRDLGGIDSAYQEVHRRLLEKFPTNKSVETGVQR